MKKLFYLPTLALLMLTMFSCEKDRIEPAADLELATEKEGVQELAFHRKATVPFKGVYYVTTEITGIDQSGTITATLLAKGNASHLGKSTWESVSNVYNTEVEPPKWVQDGTLIFTSADGSKLFGTILGEAYPFPGGGLAGDGDYVIDRGTGRFLGASGFGTYVWYPLPDQPENYLKFEGTLVNP